MTTTIRTPSIVVTLDGDALTDVLSARVQLGFNLRVAEAQVTLRSLPAGILPWQEVVIKMDADVSPATTVRFTGFFLNAEQQLYPHEVTLNCKGRLSRAEILEAEVNVDMSSYAAYVASLDDSYGHHDDTMAATVLQICGGVAQFAVVPEEWVSDATFGGTGEMLGVTSKGRGFEWREGETGLSFIERLDSVCLGYRTYDTASGTIKRAQITTIPAASSTATFTEAVDIYRATENKSIIEARNRIIVSGFPGWDGKTEISYTAETENPFLLDSVGDPWYMTMKLSSAMIEKENAADAGDGLSCEEVANWLLDERNAWVEKVVLTTPLDTAINPGDTITVVAPTRLGIDSRKFWVQEVDVSVDRRGAFSQVFTCLTRMPVSMLMDDGSSFVFEDGSRFVSE